MQRIIVIVLLSLTACNRGKRLVISDIQTGREEGELKLANDQGDKPEKVKVQLLLIRHGHACHNALNHQGTVTAHCRYPDPPLTECGIFNTECNGIQLNTQLENNMKNGTADPWVPDFVGSSALIRAMESARIMFPERKVHVLPFIKEEAKSITNLANCNHVQDIAVQKDHLMQSKWVSSVDGKERVMLDPSAKPGRPSRTRAEETATVDFQLVEGDWKWTIQNRAMWEHRKKFHFGTNYTWTTEKARKSKEFKPFVAFLGESVLPPLLKSVRKYRPTEKVVKLAVVSHANTIAHILKHYFYAGSRCNKETKFVPGEDRKNKFNVKFFKPINNGATLLEFEYDVPTKGLTLVTAADAGKDCDSLPKQKAVSDLQAEGVEITKQRFGDQISRVTSTMSATPIGPFWSSYSGSKWEEDDLCESDFKNRCSAGYRMSWGQKTSVGYWMEPGNVRVRDSGTCCVKAKCPA